MWPLAMRPVSSKDKDTFGLGSIAHDRFAALMFNDGSLCRGLIQTDSWPGVGPENLHFQPIPR